MAFAIIKVHTKISKKLWMYYLNTKRIFGISKIDGLLFKQMYLSIVTFFHDILLRVFNYT